MSRWKIIFFKINKEDEAIFKYMAGETVATCGFAHCFDAGDSSQTIDLYMADKTIERFTCHKSIFSLNKEPNNPQLQNERVKVEEMSLQLSNIETIDIQNKYNEKLESICSACCSTLKKYNASDRLVSTFIYPFFELPDVKDIYSATEIHSAQAIVLILRSVLDKEDPLYLKLEKVNSRIINPTRLLFTLSSCANSLQNQGNFAALCEAFNNL